MAAFAEYGKVATGLARNPLGIIALFIGLAYAVAALVVGTASETLQPLVWFLALFPVLVLVVFAWLVAKHHGKLYSPGDYPDAALFMETIERRFTSQGSELKKIDAAITGNLTTIRRQDRLIRGSVALAAGSTPSDWTQGIDALKELIVENKLDRVATIYMGRIYRLM